MRWFVFLLIPLLILSCSKKYDIIFNNDTDFMLNFIFNEFPIIAPAHSTITIKSIEKGYYYWLLEQIDGLDIASGEIAIYKNSTFIVWYDDDFKYRWQ